MLTAHARSTLVELVAVRLVLVRVGTADLVLELVKGDGREGGGLVNDRSLVDALVNGDGVVDSGGSDSLLLDDLRAPTVSAISPDLRRSSATHRLDGLVNVVVNVLVGNGTLVLLGALGRADLLEVLVLGPHGLELLAVLREHLLLVLADDLGSHLMPVLGSPDLLGLDGLDAVLVVVDVALTVNG